ncbi:50S ribosomal protein L24 [Candidatus Kaiserbacteria bacterium CG10_big_fil_rev_8_21_14_0_10_56_12]|uniref:Large ribosomal subunit protein uL24 n=1 Tax=Candidatus Kaiserbacteria bacterium CG10_big_fil_rev_8_21_14_0_10_56_12 TaxID=1974611 RepID=A0A2H0U9F7_9BACT|nr:MAG: 50S ribosomal protein L24 [Candidatus Kaiserbacteria bacterium CG10_big_fil_rev_8_21_14_0_10_56_12]
MHIKKGDTVKVISGKDKGKFGVVLRALPSENRVVVEGVAVAKRHTKGRSGEVGRIVERPRAIDASNVAHVEK